MANVNIYTTKTMMQAVVRMLPPKAFLRDTFFGRTETFVTEEVLADYKKGKRKMAPFVAPRVNGITMDRAGYRTDKYLVPRIAPQRLMSVDDISARMLGEDIFSLRTPEQRAAELMGQDLVDLDEMITRREEWQVRQLLLEGKIIMKGIIDDINERTVDQTVDFGFTNYEALTGADKWDTETADIYGCIEDKKLDIVKKTGIAPTVGVMATDVKRSFINNKKIQDLHNIINMRLGMIQPRIVADGVTRITLVEDLNIEFYSYDEWFIDDDGVEKPVIPAGTVILGRPNMGKRLYGAITQLEGYGDSGTFVTYEGLRIPKNWVNTNDEVKMVRLSARPLPVPDDVDDWYTLVVK